MNYDKPKLRNYIHTAPSISIWYSLVIHAIIFILALNLAKIDLRYVADDFKKGAVSLLTGIFEEKELTPYDTDINQLYRYEKSTSFYRENLITDKIDS
jgi:hypothetical protein